MGSLASRPKVPNVQPVQYVYAPAVTPSPSTTSATATNTSSGTSTIPTPTEEEVQASTRNQNLLERRRGRLGTVLTSFRGLLNDTVSGARKTLLGE